MSPQRLEGKEQTKENKSAKSSRGSAESQLGKGVALTLDNLAKLNWQRRLEHGAFDDAGVKFTLLAAGIGIMRKSCNQLFIPEFTNEASVEFFEIDSSHISL